MRRGANLRLFLLFVVALQFGYPVSQYGQMWLVLYLLLYTGMIAFGLRVVHEERDRVLPVLGIGTVFALFAVWVAVDPEHPVAVTGQHASVAAFQIMVMYSLIKFVYRRGSARSLDLILAAISVYLLIGGLFASVFAVVEFLAPGSFTSTSGQVLAWQQLMYYSYVTLATLGYGDIVPVGPWMRSLATLEAVIGTLFLTTVIARLVGIYTGHGGDRA
ncbi:potassium channel family protein [Nocardiopsis sp. LOL_012]|uniref:potassium channel family protein n=1 Tax=Nocardiopsis sp. LOL_012 TaxID=3345409 RepID=UPI003A882312